MPYLIDGHNLIPKAGLRLDSPDDEMDLVHLLQEFARLARRQVDVYFDGAPAGHTGRRVFGKVTAHFVGRGRTADSAIQLRLEALGSAAKNWTVVSSDREVQAAARSAHASVVSSEQFVPQLKAAARGQSSPGDVSGKPDSDGLSAEEVQDWLETFRKRS